MPTPSKWGPPAGIDSKDYLLYMTEPGGDTTTPPIRLLGHSLTSPSQNLTDAVTFTEVRLKGGRIQTVSKIKRAAQETSRTYTIGLPSTIWTPVMEQALRTGCTTTFFMIYLCPEDQIYEHFFVFPEATLNPPIEAEDVITTGEDTNILTQTTEMQTPEKLSGYRMGFRVVFDAAGTVAYNDLAFIEETCAGCEGGYAQKMVVVGGDGTAVSDNQLTEDRFSNLTAIPTGGAAAQVSSAVYTKGDTVLVAERIAGAPDTGEVYASYDRGATYSQITGIGEPILSIFEVDGTLLFAGGETTNGAVLYISEDNGQTVTAVTSSALPAAQPLNAMAYDEETGKLYIAGGGGTLLVGRFNGSELNLIDISANLAGAPGALVSVIVRAKNEVMVSGAAGYVAESRDGGVTFATVAIASGANTVYLDGNSWRVVAGAGTNLFVQDPSTNYRFVAQALEDGAVITGNVTAVKMNLEGDFNRFAVTTDDGEVVLGVPHYPNA